ncbi:complex I subunit 4 family protein [Helicobacter felis]|uniref:NADH-ubiquinone oxidoreductase n=1 Tax=Helicobacter felis (strain ATCC 49179 / CCUG 28539 / NCTC 12436 / CS1) TaxID=936155 RepID=E7ABU8_HELFC|nr:NADH-quinone oxidoreductase subunit M [Helicobacter felis]CBY82921.1 NADH-ubiquinone oxidoreductase [Helicobacter felis ATCC 49179]
MDYLQLLPSHLLSVLILLPMVGALPLFGMRDDHAKTYGVMVAGVELILVFWLWVLFDPAQAGMQFEEVGALGFLSQYGIAYHVGIDGISLFLLVLSAFVIFLCALYVHENQQSMLIALLLVEGMLMGVFSALNLISFYLFWEVSLLPVLYMIGRFGVSLRVYSGLKFFLYTFVASLFMLLGILYCGYAYASVAGGWSFDLYDLGQVVLPDHVRFWVALAFFLGIAVKIPIFPLHSWLPHAYGNAPILGSVVLAALLSKMGTYALLRFFIPLFPECVQTFFLPLCVLALCMVIYAGILACAQKEMKRLIAYSSMSHMGVALLGIYALNVEGVGGALFTLISHGLVSSALFLLVGIFYQRYGSSKIALFRGMAHSMPVYATFFMIATLANVGLPLTSAFVGEFLSLLGFFQKSPILAIVAGSTIVLSAIYMLALYKKVFFGAPRKSLVLSDLSWGQRGILGILMAAILFFGIYPKPLLSAFEASTKLLVQNAQTRLQVSP